MAGIRVWYQSYVDEENAGPYWQALRRHLDAVADPGTVIDVRGITPHDSYPHPIMEWRCAREMICNAVAAERGGYDAFVVGHFQDAGLYEARATIDIPVIGLGESSLLHACTLGQRIGLVTFKSQYIPWFRQQVARYGLGDRVCAIHHAAVDSVLYSEAFLSRAAADRLFRWFESETEPFVKNGSEVLVPTGGGPMVLLSCIKTVARAPVLDGVAVAIKMAEAAVRLRRLTGLGVSRAGTFAKAPEHVIDEFLTHPRGL